MSTYKAMGKTSYNFVTSFEICYSWSNLHNLSCHISACCDKGFFSQKVNAVCAYVNACLANTQYC